MNLTRILDATSEALSLTEVKNQLKITATDGDASLRFFISSVRRTVELMIGKTLITSTWRVKLDSFPDQICLPMAPVQSVSSISYVDSDGVDQAFTDFQFDEDGRLAPAYDFDWPDTRDQFGAVTITYIAGKTHAGKVDQDIKHAMLLLVGAAEVGREDIVIGAGVIVSELKNHAAANLLAPHKKVSF